MYNLSDYNYDLPSSYIAQHPVEPADSARLLVMRDNTISHDFRVSNIPDLLPVDSVLFLNDTRVLPARVPLYNTRVVTKQGRKVILDYAEVFFLEKKDDTSFEALITLLKRNRPGTKMYVSETITLTITHLTDKGVILSIDGMSVDVFLETYGKMPLPPYIETTSENAKKYQTVFAKNDGSVAAPTASLHRTSGLLHTLETKGVILDYVTLHVGLGTFKPVDTQDIRDYAIHEETMWIHESIFHRVATYKTSGKKCVAVGTTVARTLETLPYVWMKMRSIDEEAPELHINSADFHTNNSMGQSIDGSTADYRNTLTQAIGIDKAEQYISSLSVHPNGYIEVKTKIFIYPGFHRRLVDMLMTNFHLPQSTLLMLVASFVGYGAMREIYKKAIEKQYRFFSFGDAMLLERE